MRGIGEMKHLITIYKRKVDNSSGSSVETLEKALTARAARRDMSGREFAIAGGVHAESRVIFTIRKPLAIRLDSGMVLEHQGERFEVAEVIPNPMWKGMLDIRAQSTRMEGLGYV